MKALLYLPGQQPTPISPAILSLNPDGENFAAAGEFLSNPGEVVELVDYGPDFIAFCLVGPMGHSSIEPATGACKVLARLSSTPQYYTEQGAEQHKDEDEHEPLCGPVLIITRD